MRFLLDPTRYTLADPSSLPNLTAQHLSIVATSMVVAVLIALPLGVAISRYRRLYLPVVTIAGLLYTIPGLALLAVLVPVTGLDATTIIVPLVIYAQLVLIRNTVAAIDAIDPVLLEAARAMGMSRAQVLRRIVMPLALPLVVAGVRVATVTTIGIASLAALVGAGGYGDYILSGLYQVDTTQILAGAVPVTLLAMAAELSLGWAQRALTPGGVSEPVRR